jgi:hypothetical protein
LGLLYFYGGVKMNDKELKVYEEYTTEINLISKTNNLSTKEAVRLFIETVNTVEDCIFINIPKVRKRIAKL